MDIEREGASDSVSLYIYKERESDRKKSDVDHHRGTKIILISSKQQSQKATKATKATQKQHKSKQTTTTTTTTKAKKANNNNKSNNKSKSKNKKKSKNQKKNQKKMTIPTSDSGWTKEDLMGCSVIEDDTTSKTEKVQSACVCCCVYVVCCVYVSLIELPPAKSRVCLSLISLVIFFCYCPLFCCLFCLFVLLSSFLLLPSLGTPSALSSLSLMVNNNDDNNNNNNHDMDIWVPKNMHHTNKQTYIHTYTQHIHNTHTRHE